MSTREHHESLLEGMRAGAPIACEAAMRSHILETVPDLMRHLT